MIKNASDRVLTMKCRECGAEFTYTIPNSFVSRFREDLGEYENLPVPCQCTAVEIINMNIPVDDTHEPIKTGDIPIEEEIQRHYVRILQRLLREDFQV